MHLIKNFQKRGEQWRGIKICDSGRGFKKKSKKKFLHFLQKKLKFKTFLVKVRFERPVLSSVKRAQNKHKKNWRVQAKLSDVLSNDMTRKS